VKRSIHLLLNDDAVRGELIAHLHTLGHAVVADPGGLDVDVLLVEVGARDLESTVEALGAPVLFVAAHLDDDVLRASTAHGSAGVVLRPIVARELDAAIELAVFRARADKKAAIRERWYQTTLRSIGDAVITADEESAITFINPTAQALTGWSEGEAIGQLLDSVFCVETDEPAEVSASGGSSSGEGAPLLRLRRRDGTSCTIEHNAAPIVEGNGALHGVVVVFRDITEKRRIEQRLALSGRMTSIGTLAAGIAHELNNPLAFVTSNLDFVIGELAAMQGAPGQAPDVEVVEDSLAALREAADGAARAAQIVKDMKVFIRGEADPKISVDVNRALSFAARLTNSEVRHVGELEMNLEDVPATLADEGKLVQVFVNLLTNAAQAIDAKKDERKIRVSTALEGDRVVITIADTGKGIAPEHLARVFEPFFTTKPVGQGLGLGLSISHTIVSAFGGTIALDSAPGRGTVVTVSLPVGDERRGVPSHAVAGAATVAPRVLVVDDEALIGTAIRRILVKQGFDVAVENDSKKAFESIVRGARYDVIVCDLMMPGFSGVDFYEGLAHSAPDTQSRVLLMTGNAFTPRARDLFETTKNVRLEKPFLPTDLVSAVNEVLRRHGA
jgi:PAS domain S-box-containing protein